MVILQLMVTTSVIQIAHNFVFHERTELLPQKWNVIPFEDKWQGRTPSYLIQSSKDASTKSINTDHHEFQEGKFMTVGHPHKFERKSEKNNMSTKHFGTPSVSKLVCILDHFM
eukprot:TRINITY_DN15321_c0_g2_i1.p2 TRINITY_DN15321_c0_g2~~TRINITY_DN15321_c0_g2_i1.p2  ORF type:complete len:113 (+),score=9.68 TRINITY_DN15321_c0_g2_i1:1366-1704(+)